MTEDKKIVARLVKEEINRAVAFAKEEGIPMSVFSPGDVITAI
jgi:hypothetical protein